MGWEAFNHTPYKEISSTLHSGITCNDCHDPATMALRITRPAFINAMAKRGIDVTKATRQEMRSYVCGQCHVEYYFKGDNKILTFPWEKGLNIDNINDVLRRRRLQRLDAQGNRRADVEDAAPGIRIVQHGRPRSIGRGVRRLPHAVHPRRRDQDFRSLGAQPVDQCRQRLPVVPQAGRRAP